MCAEELAKVIAKADVVLGDYTFNRGIGRELLTKDNNVSSPRARAGRGGSLLGVVP